MWTTRTARILIPALLLGTVLAFGPVASGQDAKEEESDQAFLSRIRSEFDRAHRRIDYMDTIIEQKMGGTNVSSNRIGIDVTGSMSQAPRDPMSTDLRSMRLDLKSLKRKLDKDNERMSEQYRERDAGGFDRDYWEAYARRLDHDLDSKERDLRRL